MARPTLLSYTPFASAERVNISGYPIVLNSKCLFGFVVSDKDSSIYFSCVCLRGASHALVLPAKVLFVMPRMNRFIPPGGDLHAFKISINK